MENTSVPLVVLLMLVDDWGFNDVSYHNRLNADDLQMPTIDSLASTGVILENHYVNMACSPTRSSLLTARYQIHTGLQHGVIGECQPNALLPDAGPTVAEAFKQLGYSTAMYGKVRRSY